MLTGGEELLDRARVLSLHGMNRDAWKRFSQAGSWYYEVAAPGFKYNMTDVQASLGIWQLRKLTGFQRRRQEIVQAYDEAFAGIDCLETPTTRDNVEHAWHLYVLRVRLDMLAIDRSGFIEQLKARQIGTSVHFIPIHLHPFYREKYGFRPDEFPVAFRQYQRMISLPLYPAMTDADVADVIEAVMAVAGRSRRRLAA